MRDQIPESVPKPVEIEGSNRVGTGDHESEATSAVADLEYALLQAGATAGPTVETSSHPTVPPPGTIPTDETRPLPTPTLPLPQPQVQTQVRPQPRPDPPRQAPLWIDGLIVAGICILVTMLYRKIGNSSNLIETVSL
jgi:predicted component of type VI protein secretion system